ncbi:glycosyltransferase [Providencia stuartii]
MKKIIFITDGLFRTAGTERVIIQLYEIFTENDIQVTVLVPGRVDSAIKSKIPINIKSANIDDFPERGVLKKIIHRMKYFFYIRKNLNGSSHLFSFSFDLNLLNVLSRLFSKKYSIISEHIEYNYHSKLRRFLRVFAYRMPNTKLVCLTERDTKLFLKHKIDSITIPNFTYSKNSISTLKNKKILSIGRLEEQKNFSFLLDAFFHSKLYQLGWSLDIVGEGTEYEQLNNKILNYNLENYVKIHKFTNNIEPFYINASIYCMSSNYEAFPMVLIEALSYGLPIISTDCPTGPFEIIKDYQEIQLSPLNDINSYAKKLNLIANDILMLKKLSEANLNHSKVFTPEYISNQWLSLLL